MAIFFGFSSSHFFYSNNMVLTPYSYTEFIFDVIFQALKKKSSNTFKMTILQKAKISAINWWLCWNKLFGNKFNKKPRFYFPNFLHFIYWRKCGILSQQCNQLLSISVILSIPLNFYCFVLDLNFSSYDYFHFNNVFFYLLIIIHNLYLEMLMNKLK